MKITASAEDIAAAQVYEDLHVPSLFQQWTSRVADAAHIRKGHRDLLRCGKVILVE